MLMGLGKLLTTLFWCVVIANLIDPFAQPFAGLLNLTGFALFALHLLTLILLRGRIGTACARLQVLLFGSFHGVARPADSVVQVAVAEVPHA